MLTIGNDDDSGLSTRAEQSMAVVAGVKHMSQYNIMDPSNHKDRDPAVMTENNVLET